MRTRERIKLKKQLARDLLALAKEQELRPKKLKNINKRVVEQWYDQFIPNHYDRMESLFDIMKIKKGGKKLGKWGLKIEFDSDNLASSYHHQDDEIIYNNIYKQGYHGGSLGAADIMGFQPQEPSWRIHCSDMWYTTPAPKSFSIFEETKKEILAYHKEYLDKVHDIEKKVHALNGE